MCVCVGKIGVQSLLKMTVLKVGRFKAEKGSPAGIEEQKVKISNQGRLKAGIACDRDKSRRQEPNQERAPLWQESIESGTSKLGFGQTWDTPEAPGLAKRAHVSSQPEAGQILVGERGQRRLKMGKGGGIEY